MQIEFSKISDEQHAVGITRADGTVDRVQLNTRSFLRHDLAHFAVESQVPLQHGFWGSIAAGAPLSGDAISGSEAALAESLAGPMQTLFRVEADATHYLDVLRRVSPPLASSDLAARIHEQIRQLRGRWKATRFGGVMYITWPA